MRTLTDPIITADNDRLDLLADVYTEKELLTVLKVCARTLQRWEKAGTAPRCFYIGQRKVYSRRALQQWLANLENPDPKSRRRSAPERTLRGRRPVSKANTGTSTER